MLTGGISFRNSEAIPFSPLSETESPQVAGRDMFKNCLAMVYPSLTLPLYTPKHLILLLMSMGFPEESSETLRSLCPSGSLMQVTDISQAVDMLLYNSYIDPPAPGGYENSNNNMYPLPQGQSYPNLGTLSNGPLDYTEPHCWVCEALIVNNQFTGEEDAIAQMECGAQLCDACFKDYIIEKLEQGFAEISCPVYKCTEMMDPQIIQDILYDEPEWKEKYSQLNELIQYKDYTDGVPCPFYNCEGFNFGAPDNTKITCQDCNNAYCRRCSRPWHAAISCEKSEEMDFWRVMAAPTFIHCPSCNSTNHFADSENCNVIDCMDCGVKFCGLCKTDLGDYSNPINNPAGTELQEQGQKRIQNQRGTASNVKWHFFFPLFLGSCENDGTRSSRLWLYNRPAVALLYYLFLLATSPLWMMCVIFFYPAFWVTCDPQSPFASMLSKEEQNSFAQQLQNLLLLFVLFGGTFLLTPIFYILGAIFGVVFLLKELGQMLFKLFPKKKPNLRRLASQQSQMLIQEAMSETDLEAVLHVQ